MCEPVGPNTKGVPLKNCTRYCHVPTPPPPPPPPPVGPRDCWCTPRCPPHVIHLEALHIYSGAGDYGAGATTLGRLVERLSAERGCAVCFRVIEYDILNCACCEGGRSGLCHLPRHSRGPAPPSFHCGNIARDSVFDPLREDCQAGRFVAIVAGIPCDGYCKVKFASTDGEDKGPPALRCREWPTGMPWELEQRYREKLALSNMLTVRGLRLCAAIYESGGEALIENPPDYGVYGLWTKDPKSDGSGTDSAWRKEKLFEPRHCPLWYTPWASAFIRCAEARLFNFAQCQLQSEYEKYTTFAVTYGWALLSRDLMAPFDNNRCTCARPHAKQARGKDAAAAATYPLPMNMAIARCMIRIVEMRLQHGKLRDLSMAINLTARRKAMVPFHQFAVAEQPADGGGPAGAREEAVEARGRDGAAQAAAHPRRLHRHEAQGVVRRHTL